MQMAHGDPATLDTCATAPLKTPGGRPLADGAAGRLWCAAVEMGGIGAANFSFEISESDATSRGIQDPAVQSLINSGISKDDIQDPVVIWGAPNITNNVKLFSKKIFFHLI